MIKTYAMYEPTHASSFIDAKEKGILLVAHVDESVPLAAVRHIVAVANPYLVLGIKRTHYEEIGDD